jgi:hypothetical protein
MLRRPKHSNIEVVVPKEEEEEEVLCSAVVEHCHSCVCVIYMFGCVLTENCECLITVFLINIIKYFSFNSSFLSDVTCGTSPSAQPCIPCLERVSFVLQIAYLRQTEKWGKNTNPS